MSFLPNCPKSIIRIADILRGEFGEDPLARDLIADLLRIGTYRREFAERLIAVAEGAAGASWEVRRLSILMLENQFLRLRPSGGPEETWLLARIGAPPDSSPRLRLTRLTRVHRGIRGKTTAPAALADFFHVARQECKLTLSRYFFTPAEVAARIESQVRLSQGLLHWSNEGEEAIPRYEQRVASQLRNDSKIYWSDCRTPPHLNSLVECPLGTVALTLKLPGSDTELQIKRSGIRSRHPLDVRVFEGTYRLYGGSSGISSDREARSGSRLAEFYRRVHGGQPPLSGSRTIFSVQTVPAWQGEAHLLDYFTDRRCFGNGYSKMRENMAETVRGLEPAEPPPESLGDLGLTVKFLRLMPPRQAWLENTTSFRLDLLERYLSATGPEGYFQAIGRTFTPDDARRFADDLLEEILGVYSPPARTKGTYPEYVESAFAEPANRRRADDTFVSVLRQMGRLFGTLLAVWGCSFGESFVRRNVGLKSRWRDGEWSTQIIFMDHDALWVPGEAAGDFDPKVSLDGLHFDHGYLFGNEARPEQARGTIRTLLRIYRIGAAIRSKGLAAYRTACIAAYRKARRAMVENPRVAEMFDPDVAAKIADWEWTAWHCAQAGRSGSGPDAWESQVRARLAERRYTSDVVANWLQVANQRAPFLQHYATLFDPRYLNFKSSNKESGG